MNDSAGEARLGPARRRPWPARLLPVALAVAAASLLLPAPAGIQAVRVGMRPTQVAGHAGSPPGASVLASPVAAAHVGRQADPASMTAAIGAPQAVAARTAGTRGSSPLAGRVIVVDPGHGLSPLTGLHTGEHGVNGAWEDDNALAIAQRLQTLLQAQGASALLTRGVMDPGPPPHQGLVDRVAFAEQHHAAVFVSIHQNANGNPRDRGVTTYYDRPDSRGLAALVQSRMVAVTGLRSVGVLTAPFYVIARTTMPAVLVEGGFLTNPAEARTISSPAFYGKEAQALDQALLAYFSGTGSQQGAA